MRSARVAAVSGRTTAQHRSRPPRQRTSSCAQLPCDADVVSLRERYTRALQAMHPCVTALCAALKLAPTPGHRGAFHYIGGAARPAAAVSLRTIDPDHFAIINEANGETLEHIEACQAFFQVRTRCSAQPSWHGPSRRPTRTTSTPRIVAPAHTHTYTRMQVYDGAVYLFHGRPYLCKRLDLTARVAHVVSADVRYYTKPVHNRDVHVTGSRLAYAAAAAPQFGRTTARVGPAVVTERFMAFMRIWRGSGIPFDRVDLFLPDVQFTTEAAYVRCAAASARFCTGPGSEGRLHACWTA